MSIPIQSDCEVWDRWNATLTKAGHSSPVEYVKLIRLSVNRWGICQKNAPVPPLEPDHKVTIQVQPSPPHPFPQTQTKVQGHAWCESDDCLMKRLMVMRSVNFCAERLAASFFIPAPASNGRHIYDLVKSLRRRQLNKISPSGVPQGGQTPEIFWGAKVFGANIAQ